MVIGTPLVKTIAAASGSCQILNSAVAVAFPTDAEPPMRTILSSLLAASGKALRKSAIFVSGPIGTSVTGSELALMRSLINSIAVRGSRVRLESFDCISTIPSVPCTNSA